MKIACFDEGRIGLVDGDEIVDVTTLCEHDPGAWPPVGPTRLIAEFGRYRPRLSQALERSPRRPLAGVTLRTPVPWPNKVIAYPVNYHAHGREMQAGYRATLQGFFLKPNSSLSGAGEPIVLPDLPGREVHHECELAVVIGRQVRNIARDEWRDAVFGYACLLDMVVRGKEERVFRKAYDSFCPVGPWITTADEVGDPSALQARLWVNDELRQDANTRDLVLDIPGMVEMAASVMTLYPGDIIATGTPEGVGPVQAGDRVRIRIERVGEMTVHVVQGRGGRNAPLEQPYDLKIVKQ
ncbi:MAG: fumarylacetoacetate hydrolase family protein [Burkholderiales bacterium]|nr:fumarylacetoacetate hydrolase family protein [Burkholderiales bacterium]